jgi:hypothetical protein
MRTTNGAFILLTLAVFLALLLPFVVMHGMFMDGMLYAVVAHNAANGFGSFWEPRFSQVGLAGLTIFHEHPPLTFGLQARWFELFGSAYWVERLYAFCTAVITAWLLVLTWRAWSVNIPSLRKQAWWPVLLWIVVPTVHWCYRNNMQENTMGMFTTAAVLFVIMARQRLPWLLHGLAGAMVFLAAMSKGLPGLFPLAAPWLIALAHRENLLRALGWSSWMFLVTAALMGGLLLLPDAKAFLGTYVEHRLLHRIAELPTVEHRLATLEMLFSNMLVPLAIAAVLVFLYRRKAGGAPVPAPTRSAALAMTLVGISGVLPLMLTMVQKSFYMAAALPIMALAVALWSAPALTGLLARLGPAHAVVRVCRWIAVMVLAATGVTTVLVAGDPARDADMLHDVALIGGELPQGARVAVQPSLWNEWNLQGYLMRYHFISLDPHAPMEGYYIGTESPMPAAGKVTPDTRSYHLWWVNGQHE